MKNPHDYDLSDVTERISCEVDITKCEIHLRKVARLLGLDFIDKELSKTGSYLIERLHAKTRELHAEKHGKGKLR